MSLSVSQRVQRIKPSPTVALTGRVAQLKAQGKDIISLGVGEPDFDTPAHIQAAGIDAIKQGHTRYTPVEGNADLRDAIVAKFQRENGLSYKREQVLVSGGAKQTIFNLVLAVINPGDEAVIPAPYWVSYPDMVRLADGVAVIPYAGPDQGYKITPAQLAAALNSKSRLFLLNSPNNPTGAAYTHAELRALGDVLRNYPQVVICTDEMYEHIYWAPQPFVSFAAACPDLYDRTVTVNGVSKAYAMTGWRIGYGAGPIELIRAMSIIQSQSTSNPSSIAQKASVAALNGDQACVREMNRQFKIRHDLLLAGLNQLPGVSCLAGAGTFYAFANIEAAMASKKLADDNAFAEFLLNDAGVAVVPGSGFGAPGHVRLSFACSEQTLQEALRRMDKALRM
ncbi:MAG: pyridoxal phosphate-dependent aminotransferase [Candidatus Obscuribacterales bacterium]|nr:pyridoxal phosphate-dependent aminotransferase [Steroidobacteraceae bacterium]